MGSYALPIILQYVHEQDVEIKELKLNLNKIKELQDLFYLVSKRFKFIIKESDHILKVDYFNIKIEILDINSFYYFLSNSISSGKILTLIIIKRNLNIGLNYGDEDELNTNNISDPVYDTNGNYYLTNFTGPIVYCAFCHESSKDEGIILKAGKFVGPFKNLNKKYYVHQRCALWSPNVTLEPVTDRLKGIIDEIKRSNKDHCTFCHEKGAGIGCCVKNCQNGYHYLCARTVQCVFDCIKFLIYCPTHSYKCEKESGVVTKDLNDVIEPLQESNKYSCFICLSGLDVNMMIDCDGCDLTIHGYCNEPEIVDIHNLPDPWYCYKCESQEKQQKEYKKSNLNNSFNNNLNNNINSSANKKNKSRIIDDIEMEEK